MKQAHIFAVHSDEETLKSFSADSSSLAATLETSTLGNCVFWWLWLVLLSLQRINTHLKLTHPRTGSQSAQQVSPPGQETQVHRFYLLHLNSVTHQIFCVSPVN